MSIILEDTLNEVFIILLLNGLLYVAFLNKGCCYRFYWLIALFGMIYIILVKFVNKDGM